MRDDDILDGPSTHKRFSGNWKGAKFFAVAVALGVAGLLITIAIEYFIGRDNLPSLAWYRTPTIIGGVLYLFFNAAGVIVSLNYLLAGSTRDERIAGIVSLLLNLSPYLIVGKLWYF